MSDKLAANAHRVDQARALIRITRVEVEKDEEPVRAFFSIKDEGKQSYRPVGVVLNSAAMQLALLKAARRDLEAFRLRYRSIKELAAPIAEVADKIEYRISKSDSSKIRPATATD